jgi:glutathione synthase/RimK-type ligase-like ATP-grasp enzyme
MIGSETRLSQIRCLKTTSFFDGLDYVADAKNTLLSLLCITEPSTHPEKDTTVDLYRAFATHPQISLFHASPEAILSPSQLRVAAVETPESYEEFLELNTRCSQPKGFRDFDVVFCRTDRPFPKHYLETLAKYETKTRFVNRPSSQREVDSNEFIEKHLQPFMPRGIFSNTLKEIEEFLKEHPVAVAKKPNSYGGKGVFRISAKNSGYTWENIHFGQKFFSSALELLNALLEIDPESWEFVEFLNNIDKGDKRVLVVDGEIYGALLRLSPDSWVHNISAGAQIVPTEIHEREKEIVAQTCSAFHNKGIYTLGYDFLVGNDGLPVLSEVNSGNCGGYAHLDRVSDVDAVARLVNWVISLGMR